MKKYILAVWGDVEPEIIGPFDSNEERTLAARAIRRTDDQESGLYMLDADGERPEVFVFSGAALDVWSDES